MRVYILRGSLAVDEPPTGVMRQGEPGLRDAERGSGRLAPPLRQASVYE
jgi:hypothetical protein